MTTNPLRMAGQTDTGRRRHDNQDTFICQSLWSEQRALLVVIDGVGGYAGGAQAAALAAESITTYMETPTGDPLTMLREAVVHANNQIVRESRREPALAQMCCVLTAAIADTETGRLYVAHVGDTRLYRFRNETLEKLTHDHSLVGVREDANQLTESEAMSHPRRNEILRDVGSEMHRVDDPDFLESVDTDFQPGDQLLLCSDGLTDMITRAQMQSVLVKPVLLDEQVSELIELANEHGGRDNITVVLARYVGSYVASDEIAESVPEELPVITTTSANVAATDVAVAPAKAFPVKWVVGVFALIGALALGWWWGQPAPVPASTAAADSVATTTKSLPPATDTLPTPVRSLTVTDSLRRQPTVP